jgi:cobalt-zinc-cadmium resistance protein CzcA
MLDRLLDLSLHRRLAVVLTFGVLATLGLCWAATLQIDAVPDVTPVQVVVNVKTGGLDPEQAEKAVAVPIESEVAGIAGATEVRSLSKNGLAQIVIIFEDGTNIYWARQQVTERLQGVREALPDGLSPELAPVTTGLGEVLMYVVLPRAGSPLAGKTEEERLLYLRSVQDLVIRRHLMSSVPGIADVDSQGGYRKEIHVDVDPGRLERRGLSIERLVGALKTIGDNFGGGYIEHEGEQIIVRTMGTIDRLETLRDVSVGVDVRGRPIRVRDVAWVREDHAQRQGAATYQGAEAVLGTVLMLNGANSREVAMNAGRALGTAPLPSDVEVRELYSRRFLVDATLHTVLKNLAEGAALVVVILLLLLGRLRAAVLVSLAIPVSILFAAAGMRWFRVSANLMSLGAIDFGLLVDASVVIIENVMRRLEEGKRPLPLEERVALVREAAGEVVRPVTAGLLLIMLVYVPVLTLGGIEGKLFRPMAQTVLMALGASLVVAAGAPGYSPQSATGTSGCSPAACGTAARSWRGRPSWPWPRWGCSCGWEGSSCRP